MEDLEEKATPEINEIADEEDEVPIYGELRTTIQTSSESEMNILNDFEGTPIDLQNSPFTVSNDLFEGKIHMLLRDLPGNTYDFDGEKGVLWEMQIQGKFKRQIKGPIYLAMELPQEEKYKVTAPMKMVIRACLQLMKTMGHKDVHMSFGGNVSNSYVTCKYFKFMIGRSTCFLRDRESYRIWGHPPSTPLIESLSLRQTKLLLN